MTIVFEINCKPKLELKFKQQSCYSERSLSDIVKVN